MNSLEKYIEKAKSSNKAMTLDVIYDSYIKFCKNGNLPVEIDYRKNIDEKTYGSCMKKFL
jgi:hypothetical protein